MRWFGLCLCLFFMTACMKQQQGEDYKLVLRLSHVFAPKEELTHFMDLVASRIEQKTQGAVSILTYPNGQIAAYKDSVEMVVRGAHFISVEDPSYIGDYVPEFTALVGPMLYRNFDEYVALTAGLAPVSNPRVAMVVVVNEPQGDQFYGGSVAGPVFSEIMKGTLQILNVAPDENRFKEK